MANPPPINFRFDNKADKAVEAAARRAGRAVTSVTKEVQANIRNLITAAIRDGIPPYDAARTIVPLIGLTPQAGQAVLKYRRELINAGLTLEKVNEKVDKYADEKLRERGEMIARTEIMDALNEGADKALEQAQDKGLLTDDATKEVILDPDACEECVAIASQGPVPVGDDFSEDGPPFHPQCRCTIAIATP